MILSRTAKLGPTTTSGELFFDKIQELTPKNEVQHALQAQAITLSIGIGQARLLLFEQGGRSIPMPFLVLLIFWVTVIFLSFGLFAPAQCDRHRNPIPVCAFGFGRDLPDHGVGPAIRRADSDFQCPAAQRPGQYRQVV